MHAHAQTEGLDEDGSNIIEGSFHSDIPGHIVQVRVQLKEPFSNLEFVLGVEDGGSEGVNERKKRKMRP